MVLALYANVVYCWFTFPLVLALAKILSLPDVESKAMEDWLGHSKYPTAVTKRDSDLKMSLSTPYIGIFRGELLQGSAYCSQY
jgi:hypothetical protein